MATQLRVLDDAENLNDYFKTERPPLGIVIQADETKTDLHFRDLTNKIMRAERFEWALSEPANPRVACISNDPTR